MRIHYISHPVKGQNWGGPHDVDVLHALQQLGHTVTGMPDYSQPPEPRKPSLWEALLWLARPKFLLPMWQMARLELATALKVKREWTGADVIYTRHRWLNLAEVLLRKFYGIPVVKELNGIVADEVEMARGRDIPWRIIKRVERWNMRQADGWIVASELIAKTLHEDFGVPAERMMLAQFGADAERFKPAPAPTNQTVCWTGTIWEVQGLDVLVQAWPQIKASCPEAKAVLAGLDRIGLERSLPESIKTDFTFLGELPQEEMPRIINSAAVCIGPLTWHKAHRRTGLCSVKLCEYMACGKPVVAARIPGLEFVEQSRGGLLVESGNAWQLGLAINFLLEESVVAQRMGQAGRQYVECERTWLCFARKVEANLQAAVDEGQASAKARLRFTSELIPAGSVLDIGSHDGELSRLLGNVTSIDTKPVNKGVIQADALHLPFANRSFDTVTCLEVLEHLTDTELPQAVSEIKRVAREHIVISVPNNCTKGISGHLQSFRQKDMEKMFGKGNFYYYGSMPHFSEGFTRRLLPKGWLPVYNRLTGYRRWLIGVFNA